MADKLQVAGELESLKNLLENYPNGAVIEQIEANTNLDLPRRTLQRRLAELEKSGDIEIEGKTKGTRYTITRPKPYYVAEAALGYGKTEDSIPLSKESKVLQNIVNRPLNKRQKVGYNRAFLDGYSPNTTNYLNKNELEKLSWLSKTGIPHLPAGTYARQILSRLLIDLSWNSSRLEGNTYSLLDTQLLLAQGHTADEKTAAEAQMILNHKDAIEFLVEATDDIGFNRYTLLNLHALLANNLMPDRGSPGRLRRSPVGIHQSVFTPLAFPQQIEEMFELIMAKVAVIKNPFEQAFFLLVQLPYLQPFDDVNKRVSRLAANIPFIQHNLSPLSYVDVPNELYTQGIIGVYENNRTVLLKDVFIWAYERSAQRYANLRQTLGEPDVFRMRYRDEIRMLIADIIRQAFGKQQAVKAIQASAARLPAADRGRFTEAVETELLSLHGGNFARYKVPPSVFNAWKMVWD